MGFFGINTRISLVSVSIQSQLFQQQNTKFSLKKTQFFKMKTVFVLCLFVVAAYAASSFSTTPIPIVRLVQNIKENGSDNDFETGNGIKGQEETSVLEGTEHTEIGENGELVKTRKEIKKTGSFSYTAPSGEVVSMSYVADETGFHPVGPHIPTAPPMPAELVKAFAEAAARPVFHEEE